MNIHLLFHKIFFSLSHAKKNCVTVNVEVLKGTTTKRYSNYSRWIVKRRRDLVAPASIDTSRSGRKVCRKNNFTVGVYDATR